MGGGSAFMLEVAFYPERKRGYKGVWGIAPSGAQGQSPWWGLGGEAPENLWFF